MPDIEIEVEAKPEYKVRLVEKIRAFSLYIIRRHPMFLVEVSRTRIATGGWPTAYYYDRNDRLIFSYYPSCDGIPLPRGWSSVIRYCTNYHPAKGTLDELISALEVADRETS